MKDLDRAFESYSDKVLSKSLKGIEVLKAADFHETATADVEPYRPPKEIIRRLVGKTINYPDNIGDHPDFAHLQENESEYHYIVSAFIDLKGSTVLATKLPLADVRFIKNGLLVTAIDIIQAFDGHVHRLQGDAIFAFFGRKNMARADAIIDALNATTFFQFFIKNSLSPKFEQLGFPPLRIRTGIDYGGDDKVLWTKYGIKNCSEITTTSLHTDLASKMQSRAAANTIVIGQNIVDFLDLPDEFYSVKTYQKDKEVVEDKYIIDNTFLRYGMWQFDWDKYIDRFPFMDATNPYPYKAGRDFEVKCYYKPEGDSEYIDEYRQNCGSLPKELHLKFEATVKPHFRCDDISWEVNNRGEEATLAGALNFPMTDFEGKTYCLQSTAYKGHHYLVTTLKYQGRTIGKDYFGVYVRN